jgi:2-oxoglutarate ferredoxin oxidoreductase subunit delta
LFIAVIEGTGECVLYHDEVVPECILTSPAQGVLPASLGSPMALDSFASRIDVICVTPTPTTTPHNYGSFRGVFCHLERGDLMAKGRVSIVVERCKACGFCVEFCPTHVLALSSAFNSKGYHPPHVVHPEKCSGCDLCGMYCPDFAIAATKIGPTGGGEK